MRKHYWLIILFLLLIGCSTNKQEITRIPTLTAPIPTEQLDCTIIRAKMIEAEELNGEYSVTPIWDEEGDRYVFNFLLENDRECLRANIYPFKYLDWNGEYPKEYPLNQTVSWDFLEEITGEFQIIDGSIEPIFIIHENGWLDERFVQETAVLFNKISGEVFTDFELDLTVGAYYLASNICKYDIVEEDYTSFCSEIYLGQIKSQPKYLAAQGDYWIINWTISHQAKPVTNLVCEMIISIDNENSVQLINATPYIGDHDSGYLNPIYLEFQDLETGYIYRNLVPAGAIISKNGLGLEIPKDIECGSVKPPERICRYCG